MTEVQQAGTGWRLDWRALSPRARSIWWDQLWSDAIQLSQRYRLVLRSRWWEDDVQVETLAAVAALVSGYDSGGWNDPVAKLQFLYDLDRIRAVFREGENVFEPDRDRADFTQHLVAVGCEIERVGAAQRDA
jgi:hypothetical protein